MREIMTEAKAAKNDLARIATIDAMFADAAGPGSWMISLANEREAIVDRLRYHGHPIEHTYRARNADGSRTD